MAASRSIPKGSLLGLLLPNVFLNDIYLLIINRKLYNCADSDTIFSRGKKLNVVKSNLACNFLIVHKWFRGNHMVLNPEKCHYMLIGNKSHDNKIVLNGLDLKY